MPRHEIGTKVYAIYGSTEATKTLKVLGPGTYVGNEIPTTAVGWLAEAAVEGKMKNPKILLDNGDVVWGCECWWGVREGGEQQVEAYKKDGWTIETIRIEDERAKHRAEVKAAEAGK